jgi:hypothetical protein
MQSNGEQKQRKIKDLKPVLLSRSELQWLLGSAKFSKPFEYKMKNSIRRKIQTLSELELPLLIENNFFVNGYYEIDDDDGIGRDLELGPPPQPIPVNSSLVRQRSRVQIPAKAPLFCKKEGESGFSLFYLPYMVFHYSYTVFAPSHNEYYIPSNRNQPSLTGISLQL